MMQSHRLFLAVLVLCLVGVGPASRGAEEGENPDPSGSWRLKLSAGGLTVEEATLSLQWEGETLTGVWDGRRGKIPLQQAKLAGSELSFQLAGERNGRKFVVDYLGAIRGETMKGTVELEFGGQRRSIEFEGERVKEAPSVAGTWKITISAGDGQLSQPSLKLIQDGEKLEGVYTAGFDGKETPISSAALAGKKLTFQVRREGRGGDLTLEYSGEVDGDALRGTLEYALGERKGTAPFEARPLEQFSLAIGTWKLAVATQSKRTFQPVVKLAEKDGKLTGLYLGERGETPVEEPRVEGKKLSFRVKKQRGERMYTLLYRGTLSGDTINGVVAYSFDGETGTLPFEGRREKSLKPETEGDSSHEGKKRAF